MTQLDTQKTAIGILPSPSVNATKSGVIVGVTPGSGMSDAPSDGNSYVRKNGAWVLETIYRFPIGSVYLNITGINPATELGYGVWSAIAVGEMLVGFKAGDPDFGVVEATGGNKTVAHTNNHSGTAVADHAAHSHELPLAEVEGTPDKIRVLDAAVFGSGTSRATTGDTNITESTTAANVMLSESVNLSSHVVTQPNAHADHNILNPYYVVYVWKRTA